MSEIKPLDPYGADEDEQLQHEPQPRPQPQRQDVNAPQELRLGQDFEPEYGAGLEDLDFDTPALDSPALDAPATGEASETQAPAKRIVKKKEMKPAAGQTKPQENRVVRLLEKNPLGMTLPEMAGGPRQVKKIRLLRPMLAEAIREGLVMPVSQRAGNTVYRLVKFLGPR